jgi:hypothetical protein
MSSSAARAVDKETCYRLCPRCAKRRKMRILRPLDETGLEWLNCLACNGLLCVTHTNGSNGHAELRIVGDFGAPAPDEFRTYVPEEAYEVGEFIYHQTWRDVGKVISRRDLAGGRTAIDVAFLNYGPKSLIVEAEEFVR